MRGKGKKFQRMRRQSDGGSHTQQQGRREERESGMERGCREAEEITGQKDMLSGSFQHLCCVLCVFFKSLRRKSSSFARKEPAEDPCCSLENLHFKNRYKIQTRVSSGEVDQEVAVDCHRSGGFGLDWMEEGSGKGAGEFAASSVCSVGSTLESTQFPPQELRFCCICYIFYILHVL